MKLYVTEGTEQGMPNVITKSKARIRQAIDYLAVHRAGSNPKTTEQEVVKFLNDADTAKKLATLGADANSSTPEGLMQLAEGERKTLANVIRTANIKAE